MVVTALEGIPADLSAIGVNVRMGPRRRKRGQEGEKTYKALPYPL
jgi:hypothetical protein